MADRAPLIGELEDILNNAGSDQELCDKAIEIVEWIIEERKDVEQSGSLTHSYRLTEQEQYFTRVIEQIQKRRHAHALDAFIGHCVQKGYII